MGTNDSPGFLDHLIINQPDTMFRIYWVTYNLVKILRKLVCSKPLLFI